MWTYKYPLSHLNLNFTICKIGGGVQITPPEKSDINTQEIWDGFMKYNNMTLTNVHFLFINDHSLPDFAIAQMQWGGHGGEGKEKNRSMAQTQNSLKK